ncbi:diguanylate cyclase [Aurantiacibacter aquimixticola]|uniref:diguanylate cyclase n=1 Tax=Aurantiacibacter aquimixticola TaxID=1958945 RepID=A0A419RQG4_9SPHN|nr:diguanylate cyclase [Aurantiacibacter aquimixticola]
MLFALAWIVVAAASMALRAYGEAAVLLWLPSGVAAAAFTVVPVKRWWILILTMLAAQIFLSLVFGSRWSDALSYSIIAIVQAIIAAGLGLRALGGQHRAPARFAAVLGIFGAAVTAALIGAALALPIRADQTLSEFFWWFSANVIGILVATPLILRARRLLQESDEADYDRILPTILAVLCLAVLGTAVLVAGTVALAPAVVTAAVFITFRFGHTSSALCVLAFGAMSTFLSTGGNSPAPGADLSVRDATLAVQSWMLLMMATTLPVAAMLMKREELQLQLIGRNAGMHENLMLLDLAEELAGIGRWRFDMVTGQQNWTPRMLELCGLSPDLAPDPGDVRDLLPDRARPLFSEITANREARETYSFDYQFRLAGNAEKILRISVLNEFDIEGRRVALFGVAMDVTDQVQREQALDLARGRAVKLAAEAQKLANTDPLTSLPNRRCTFARLKTMVDLAGQRSTPLTALMFDIDHFKTINDTYGHQTGDEVIVQVAELARRQARHGDVVGRIGGEEFVWLLPGVGGPAARRLAERLRGAVESGLEGSTLPNVTISIGLAQFQCGDTGDQLLARADAALYEAKEHGRNQVRRAA